MSRYFFRDELAAANGHLAKAAAHLENYLEVQPFDAWDSGLEWLFAREEIRLAKIRVSEAAKELAAEMARAAVAKGRK